MAWLWCSATPLVDRHDIERLEDWWTRIEDLIKQASTVVFVLSPASVSSEVCEREVAFAASLSKRLAPVVAEAVTTNRVPDALGRLNYVFLNDETTFESEVDRLVAALNTDLHWVRKHSDYGSLARRWADEGRTSSLLLTGRALAEAERWIAARPADAPVPTDDMQALILASRRAATRRRNALSGVGRRDGPGAVEFRGAPARRPQRHLLAGRSSDPYRLDHG